MNNDNNEKNLLTVLLLNSQVLCFVRDVNAPWRHEPIYGEANWHPLGTHRLADVLKELDKERMNLTTQLAGFRLHLLYGQADIPLLDNVAQDMTDVRCTHWQVLEWEPLRDRAAVLAGGGPNNARPGTDWLLRHLLPVLQATFDYQEDALAAERVRAEHAHADTLESLRADRLRLEAEIAAQRAQLAALQRPELEEIVTFLPALYRNVFGTIAPHDLTLLAGGLDVPRIASPWPEPTPDTVQALQVRLRKLPAQRATQLRNFCRDLPHKLEPRAEMRGWLGED